MDTRLLDTAKRTVDTAGGLLKNIGKPCTGKLHARVDEGELTNTTMSRLLRHRQTKKRIRIGRVYGGGNLPSTRPLSMQRFGRQSRQNDRSSAALYLPPQCAKTTFTSWPPSSSQNASSPFSSPPTLNTSSLSISTVNCPSLMLNCIL